ncbi:MAG: hypothetical protein ABIR81_08185 [Ginsengibacter sp.]
MVAAHGWDRAGAMQAELQDAFIERKGHSLYPLLAKLQYIGKDLKMIAEAFIKGQPIFMTKNKMLAWLVAAALIIVVLLMPYVI